MCGVLSGSFRSAFPTFVLLGAFLIVLPFLYASFSVSVFTSVSVLVCVSVSFRPPGRGGSGWSVFVPDFGVATLGGLVFLFLVRCVEFLLF